MSVGPHAEKFNVVNNDRRRMLKCDFSVFKQKFPSWVNLVKKKNQNCQFKLKFGIWVCKIQWWCSLFLSDCKHIFWANLVRKIKIVSLSWNLIPRLIRTCRIHWCSSLLLISTGITFFGKLDPKNQNCQFKLKYRT